MAGQETQILIINSGSSSVKFAVFCADAELKKILHGSIEKIGSDHAVLRLARDGKHSPVQREVDANQFSKAPGILTASIEEEFGMEGIKAIGHRIVFGMERSEPAIIDDQILRQLKQRVDYDPDHLPAEIGFIESLMEKWPGRVHVACFDTAFHAGLPDLARVFPLPASYAKEGIRRYGYHGISYSYLMDTLRNREGSTLADGRIILAHLGNGASLAAVKNARCVDTSMGFTPAGGFMMGTRSGDLDPGIAWYLMQNKGMTPDRFNQLINHESGLLGVSGLSADMQELLENENPQAAFAIELFCYQVSKWIGAFTVALGGLETLVFSGGIGEHAPIIRERICGALEFFGLKIEEGQNRANQHLISTSDSRIKVFVIPTDEEIMMGKLVLNKCAESNNLSFKIRKDGN